MWRRDDILVDTKISLFESKAMNIADPLVRFSGHPLLKKFLEFSKKIFHFEVDVEIKLIINFN